ncbi:MAG TPA: TonB-dependent receptor plug domain-containing protein [Allosphingosinicella sp.]|nr:TonB-dependent receptor plug domain-containing protein [Allosphingosinicella sp.]
MDVTAYGTFGLQASRAALALALAAAGTPALAQPAAAPAQAATPAPAPAGGEPQTPVDPGESATDPAAVAVPPRTGPRTFTPQDFARFAPRTALDMIRQVPGFTIRDAPQERGLGQATANVLINGQRIGGKSDDVGAQLGRTPAANVIRIEIVDGATLDVPGLSGEVANVITRATRTNGQFSWRPEFRLRHTNPLFTRFDTSVSGQTGPVEWTFGLENQANRGGAGGRTQIFNRNRALRELRDDGFTASSDQPRASARFVYDGPGADVGNLNLSYRRFWHRFDELGLRTTTGAPERERTVDQNVSGYQYEIGGDYELGIIGGRLKLTGLNRFEREPVQQTVVTAFADGRSSVGSRFERDSDELERIGRAEFRWRGGGAEWQISGEAAFNRLDVESRIFTLDPDGTFRELSFPAGTGAVAEDRYEVIGSYGRPLAPNLTMQLSAGGEYSQLSQAGPNGLTRSFVRPKGQLALNWRPDPRTTLNLRLQRRVGQLNFLDFLATVNFSDDRENAGNPELVPPQSWEMDLEGIRNLGRYGTTRLRLYGRLLQDVVDTIPIGATGESPGNIDKAGIYGFESNTTFNFDPMGWRGARLDARLQMQRSRVEDPLTGEDRPISGSLVRLAEVSLRHDVPGTDWAWGASVAHFKSARNVRLTEISRQSEGPAFAGLFVEHKDLLGLTVRATANNVLGARSNLDRTVFVGRRTGPIDFIEDRNRTIGPIFSFSVRGRF